jgi:hypothetical protein
MVPAEAAQSAFYDFRKGMRCVAIFTAESVFGFPSILETAP